MDRLRRDLWLTGLAGLLLSAGLAGGGAWVVASGTLRPPLPHRLVTWMLVASLGAFSLAEIPMMVVVMRRLVVERAENRLFVLGLHLVYVAFAAVYGLPVLLLTGSQAGGLGLCALSLVRLAASLLAVRSPAP